MELEKNVIGQNLPHVATAEELFNLGAVQENSTQIIYKEKGVIIGWIRESPESTNYIQFYSGYTYNQRTLN